MAKEKTKFGKFLQKAGGMIPGILGVTGKLVTGNISGAIEEAGNLLKKEAVKNEEAKSLLMEFERDQMAYAVELFELEAKDRDSARNREIKLAEAGKFDLMFLLTGISGLGSFLFCIYAVVFIPSVRENDLFVHLIGMIEGVVISNIYAYYFGTSKSSSDKNKLIK